ncbi:MAG TPA: NAD(P)/FAD-dependent oxidoreductase [Ktedonobacterales bacterium]|nr:NAD(P)/FAD-dependent oxidoreductase [Ktedonobacterales bacterium]
MNEIDNISSITYPAQRRTGEQPRVVIVGAGFGGLEAALKLGRAPVHVTVIDRNNHYVFQPLLYQVATAYLSPADITAPIRTVLRRQRNTEVLLAEATAVDVTQREVRVRDEITGAERSVPYDYLVLATGAGESYFGRDDWATHAPSLKTIPDATALRRRVLLAFEEAELMAASDPERVRSLLTFVIVGGGPTGVELAGAIAELAHRTLRGDFRHIDVTSARIVLIEALPRLLNTFPESLSEKATRKLEKLGVEVRTGGRVEEVDADGVIVAGERIASRTVIWAAGVKASPAGAWIGAETDRAGRVLVNGDLSVPDHPEIFVLGDTASAMGDGGKPLPGVAPVAMQQGRYVGRTIRARVERRENPRPFKYFNKGNLATIGRSYAIADFGFARVSGFIAWVLWLGVHILYLIGFRNRLLVMLQWAWEYFTYEHGARIITPIRQPEQRALSAEREPVPAGRT